MDIDAILTSILEISTRLEALAEDDPRRVELERERADLRRQAANISDTLRHPDSVTAEIEMLERRRAEIEAMAIGKGWSEKRLHNTIQDPSAYSQGINRRLAENHTEELEEIDARLAHLKALGRDA